MELNSEFTDSFEITSEHLYFAARLAVKAAGFLSHERSEYVAQSLCTHWTQGIHEKELMHKIRSDIEWLSSSSDSLELVKIFLYYINREAEELAIARSSRF
ncbi:hypothetical protein OTK49_02150 [Vibrio coralliirubri]|uniref:hypothetical protein n=1 Tax=Vibrio coralliirubri TaxID=1516159 RepID=UPI002283AED9|nr:hypothetical protein [Vibrio coralliirubri]MCY9861317.1 hypothetical protein [Vibrio coralliirubri]